MKDRSAIRAACDEINSPKSRLMELANRIDRAGAHADAEALMKVIGRLEAVQNRILDKHSRP